MRSEERRIWKDIDWTDIWCEWCREALSSCRCWPFDEPIDASPRVAPEAELDLKRIEAEAWVSKHLAED